MPPAAATGRKRRRAQQDDGEDSSGGSTLAVVYGGLPTPPRTRGRPRKPSKLSGEDDEDTPGELAFQVTREALDMLRETLAKLEGLIKDGCQGCPDNLRTLQLDAMAIHNDIMGLHLDMISAKASDDNIEREAHSFQRRSFKLHQAINKMQPQDPKPKVVAAKIKSVSLAFQLQFQRTDPSIIRHKAGTRRPPRDSDTVTALEKVEVATQTEAENKERAETVDLAVQTKDLAPSFPAVSASLRAEHKISKIPRFFLETLSSKRYEEFTTEQVAKAFKLGSRLADFVQTDVFFSKDYSNIHGDLVGDLYNKYIQRED
ncbi:uncharacterized protein PG986_012935 [Apiospora aurea]|uniref:Uncharacterized protein n=1 Tax=Apiospora aurea TaxID=335848 RepID=A0ABR1Q234_9PEZI